MLDWNEYSLCHMLGVNAVHQCFFCPDIDECCASSPVCDINANCSYTPRLIKLVIFFRYFITPHC